MEDRVEVVRLGVKFQDRIDIMRQALRGLWCRNAEDGSDSVTGCGVSLPEFIR